MVTDARSQGRQFTTSGRKQVKKVIRPVIHQRRTDSTLRYLRQNPNDTQYFYYRGNRSVSVKVTPRYDGRQWYILYAPNGQEMYRQEAIYESSYQQSVELRFQPNGAVEKMNIHLNPGASMYWYETEISFSWNNQPEWRQSRQMPEHSVTIPVPEYWDKKTNTWRRQEVMDAPGVGE